MPFMTPDPVCYVFDLITLNWEPIPRKIVYSCCSQSTDKYQPFITAVAAIGSKIYMFGGRQVQSSTLSNSMYVLDTNTFVLQKLHCRGNSPQPRFDHSFDTLYNRYLVVFGGLCLDSSGENDLYIFDTKTDMWIEPGCQGQIPSPRYGHASVMVGDELYIFGGTQVEADGNIVYDMLYKLDCKTWIWSKFDHPEAQRYRRKMYRNSQDISDADYLPANMDRQISFSLEKDCVIETTGNPPRERLQCSLLYISNKLMLFGGQTIRQNREDTNVLHAYSICSVDIFDIRHRHWSKKYTKLIGIADNIYPQDVCCFSVQDICDPRLPGQRLLVLGQQREFDSPTASSGTGFSGSLGGSIYESDSSRHSSCIYGQETSGLNTQNSAGGTQDSEDCSNESEYTFGKIN
ncbi:hypothetical protein J3Q64DRAFT_1637775 [Phycomyces blakesleeanus]|uniref:Uncharacterized protein n=1 Tax=Phycomyces blakesleeanus TaxID=4837 RepID=A0ABR3B245_PHYBL